MWSYSNVDRFDVIGDSTLAEDCKAIHSYLDGIKTLVLYTSTSIPINGGASTLAITSYDISDWDKWLEKNSTRFYSCGLRAYDYKVFGNSSPFSNESVVIKCTCGTAIALGREDDLLYHSDWCDLKGKK